jgi:murein DD-endopeptidase MepM/ murein hydrolase activator NlpD
MNRFSKPVYLTVKLISLMLIATLMATAFPPQAPVLAADCAVSHTVVSGDTLSSIALKYNTTVAAIAAENNLKEPYTLQIGQTLCIPGASTSSSSSSSTTTTSTSTKPSFTVTFLPSGRHITVKTANYPKKNTFVVNTSGQGTAKYHLGLLKTTKSNTSVQKTYQLPKPLRGAGEVTVCLKNKQYDNLQCNRYEIKKDGTYSLKNTWSIVYTVVQ